MNIIYKFILLERNDRLWIALIFLLHSPARDLIMFIKRFTAAAPHTSQRLTWNS